MANINKFTRKYLLTVFLSGLFIGVGVDPEQEIIKALISVIEESSPVFAIALRVIIALGGIYLSVIMWKKIYTKYNYVGIISATLVFIGIILVVADFTIGVWMLIIGFIIGMLITQSNRKRKRY